MFQTKTLSLLKTFLWHLPTIVLSHYLRCLTINMCLRHTTNSRKKFVLSSVYAQKPVKLQTDFIPTYKCGALIRWYYPIFPSSFFHWVFGGINLKVSLNAFIFGTKKVEITQVQNGLFFLEYPIYPILITIKEVDLCLCSQRK